MQQNLCNHELMKSQANANITKLNYKLMQVGNNTTWKNNRLKLSFQQPHVHTQFALTTYIRTMLIQHGFKTLYSTLIGLLII